MWKSRREVAVKKSEPQGSPLYMLRNQNTHQDAVPPPIAVTAVINLVEGGRREEEVCL